MGRTPKLPPTPEFFRSLLHAPDDVLLQQCDLDTYRASGPGGQKRNKTSSAVRLRLRNSGLACVAVESRSQHENKAKALRRLRERIAVEFRLPMPAEFRWPEAVQIHAGRLTLNPRNPALPLVVALVLDAWATYGGEPAMVGERLGVSGSSVIRFLAAHSGAWAVAARIRTERGMAPLRAT